MAVNNPWTWGLGRRKTAVARVRIKPGSGAFLVNGRALAEYFPTWQTRTSAGQPLHKTELSQQFDVFCTVHGGGPTGQADAVSLGLSRALKASVPSSFDTLRAEGLMTRDQRMKERKHYGRKGARRGFQFSKR